WSRPGTPACRPACRSRPRAGPPGWMRGRWRCASCSTPLRPRWDSIHDLHAGRALDRLAEVVADPYQELGDERLASSFREGWISSPVPMIHLLAVQRVALFA